MLVVPTSKVVLKMFAPNVFPIAMFVDFSFMELIAVTSSGRLVPIATIVTPMICSLSPKICAIFSP